MRANLAMIEDPPGPRAQLRDPQVTVKFMLAGNAHVTFQSRRTGTRFTYRVRNADKIKHTGGPSHFVDVLVGPDNDSSYQYLGCIYNRRIYAHGRNSRVALSATSAVAFVWVWGRLTAGQMHPELDVYHEGRCGKCGRRLTTPESIETGLGPVCATRGES